MTEDRFEDLGAERRAEIGEQLEERDRTHPEPRRPEVPRPGNKYAWAAGIVAVMGLSVLLFFPTLPNQGKGYAGPPRNSIVRPFAAPNALGNLEGAANVCAKRERCNDRAGNHPACTIHSKEVVNVCDLRRKPLVLTFIFDRAADCYLQDSDSGFGVLDTGTGAVACTTGTDPGSRIAQWFPITPGRHAY